MLEFEAIIDGTRKKYKKRGGEGTSLRSFVFDIIKDYASKHKNITYKELSGIFKKDIFSHNLEIILNENGEKTFMENTGKDNKLTPEEQFEKRYPEKFSFKLNDNSVVYITGEWRQDPENQGRFFDAFLSFAKNKLGYEILIKEEELPIVKKIINSLRGKENNTLTRDEIINLVLEKYPDTNTTSVIPSDYCYNQKNKGSRKYELFEYLDRAKYRYLGENYKSTNGNIYIIKNSTKNIILYGVPGVGKTYSHKKLIDMIESKRYSDTDIFKNLESHDKYDSFDKAKEEDRVKFITFHQSFGYEDFIEGFRPNDSGKIELRDGVFKDFCKKAEGNKDENHYFIIDEINRGNISKIFGELITLIEEDKRDTLQVDLPYSKQPFSIPSNIYIIGTMNSTDKSIALIDIALRRRFVFLKMKPNLELIKDEKAKELMQKINDKIKETLGEDYQIGHSYFMSISNDEQLEFVKSYKIKPLLEEYFYGNEDSYKEIL